MKENTYPFFLATMKMADVVLRNYTLVSVLPRFDIRLGFGEKSVSEVCAKHGVETDFFLMVCNIHTFDDYLPSPRELMQLQVGDLLRYLEKSHTYYTDHRIATIEKRLGNLVASCQTPHGAILNRFFTEYRQEVTNHFDYEELTVFPYIEQLLAGLQSVNYHINQYEENHSNIDDKLSDLKSIIIKYLPESCSSEERNELLTEIFLFEEDLLKHTRIEDKVLIPIVREIEKSDETR